MVVCFVRGLRVVVKDDARGNFLRYVCFVLRVLNT